VAEPLPGSVEPSLVIGIGASAGGVEALRAALAELPVDLDVAVLVVLHLSASGKSLLAPILARVTPLKTDVAVHGEPVVAGRVYVAPADRHLLVHNARIVLSRGPKENGARPAVDPTLRSLGYAYGPRAVAVILSGALGDGSAGAAAVADRGGVVIIQDPHEAIVPSMPQSAQRAVGGRARIHSSGEIASVLAQLADERRSMGEDVAMLPDPPGGLPTDETPDGPPTSLTCPECGGPLWDEPHGEISGYRCRVGHVYSEDALVNAQAESVEAALWATVEVLEERAELLRRVARRRGDPPRTRSRLEEGADDARRRAGMIRRALASSPEGSDAFGLEAAGGAE
jgi:two-component system, chemotaxis family, protein-glutamate methylesterase/glutaminase